MSLNWNMILTLYVHSLRRLWLKPRFLATVALSVFYCISEKLTRAI